MSRRRRRTDNPVSLFPFLSILACVIGTLTLLIAGLSLGAMVVDTRGAEYAEVTEAIAGGVLEKENLERVVVEAHEVAEELRRASMDRLMLDERLSAAEDFVEQVAELTREKEEMEWDRMALEVALEETHAQIAETESEMEARREILKSDPEIRIIGPPAEEGGRRLRPRFVECRQRSIVLNAGGVEADQRTVFAHNLPEDPAYQKFLRQVKRQASSGWIVVFLIRPGGVSTFDAAYYGGALRNGVRSGYLPVPGNGALDLSLFQDPGGR